MPTSPTTPTYTALVAKVRDWANRDSETLPDSIIKDAIRYGADNIYRELRLPPLEHTVTYTVTAAQNGTEVLNIPEDLSEFISLRRLDGGRSTGTVDNADQSIIYNQKADYRTFRDIDAQQYDFYRWTRRGNEILIHPPLREGEEYELYYYRRLPAMNATYAVNTGNFNANLLVDLGMNPPPVTIGTGTDAITYNSGTPLFFQQFANVTGFSMEAAANDANAIQFNLTFDRAFTTAEQATLIASSTTAGSARDDYALILSENDVDIFDEAQRTVANRLLFVHISRDTANTAGITPAFSNNGQTISWILYPFGTPGLGTTRANIIRDFGSWHPRVFTGAQVDTIVNGYLGMGNDNLLSITEATAFNADGTVARDTNDSPQDLFTTRSSSSTTGGGAGTGRSSINNADHFQTLTGELNHSPVPGQDVPSATNTGGLRAWYFFGEEPPHWLRDEQEKIIIWMALVHIFDYLGEMEMMQKYLQKAQAEMQQLNLEEGRRRVSGGNTQQNFDGFLI